MASSDSKLRGEKPPGASSAIAHPACKHRPVNCNPVGSSAAGNKMPDSKSDGKNTSWDIIASFAPFLTAPPSTLIKTAISSTRTAK